MRADVSLIQHLHLAVVVAMLLAGCHAVGHRLIHLVAGIDHRLNVLLLQVFFGEFGDLLVGDQLATSEDGLCELSKGVQEQLARIDNYATGRVGPSDRTAERDAGEKG